MATIGQSLKTPESGWKRYDDSFHGFEYRGGQWLNTANVNEYSGMFKTNNIASNPSIEIRFKFIGTKIRIIAPMMNNCPSNIKIFIDGLEESFDLYNSSVIWNALVYEKSGLENTWHSVIIRCSDEPSRFLRFSAVDIDDNGELEKIYTKLIVKNPTTNQHYSLAEKTLISLPNASDKNMILHGIEAGKEIRLDEAFDKVLIPSSNKNIVDVFGGETFNVSDYGNKFKKIKLIKEVIN